MMNENSQNTASQSKQESQEIKPQARQESKSHFRPQDFQPIISFIWSVADTLRDVYVKGKYRDVILPMVVIRRIDAVLEPSKAKVLDIWQRYKDKGIEFCNPLLTSDKHGSGHCFYNTSPYTLKELLKSPNEIKPNFESYINGFSENIKDIIDKFDFRTQIKRLNDSELLYTIIEKFCDKGINFSINPTPTQPALSNLGMGYVFEELIRKFNEENNEEAGEHFTPREVIKLMTHLLFLPVKDKFTQSSFSIYDNACGSGGMLTESKAFIEDVLGSKQPIELFGQEINPETYALCKADMMIKGENPDNIKFGSTLSDDKFSDKTFDFMLTNPPYGKDWGVDIKKLCKGKEDKKHCTDPRFKVGLSAKSDGQMMFLLNQISKMKDPKNSPLGSRIASVHNGSSLFNSDSGMVAIRKFIIESDLLEAIIALPTDMFYNTGIPTFIWILTNNKEPRKRGKIQLINATSESFYSKMKKSLGKKSKQMLDTHIDKITALFENFADKKDDEACLVLDNADFGYQKIIIERPKSVENLMQNEKFKELKEKDKILAKLRELETQSKSPALSSRHYEEATAHTTRHSEGATALTRHSEPAKAGEESTAKSKGVNLNVDSSLSTKSQNDGVETYKDKTTPHFTSRQDFLNFLGIKLSKTEQNLLIDSDKNANTEKIPLKADIQSYYEREVLPFVPHSWINYQSKEIGYEVLFNKFFYTYTPPRALNEIQGELNELEKGLSSLLSEILK